MFMLYDLTTMLLHYTRVKRYCNKLTSTDFNKTSILTASRYYDHFYPHNSCETLLQQTDKY